jgi:hypothetical protein
VSNSLFEFLRDKISVTLSLTGGVFGGNRGERPVPPEKGFFPLNHQHECDLVKAKDSLKF